ncbi:MAG: class I SAM-dependent methyltransferase [Solirubrobacteraceae bacterium]
MGHHETTIDQFTRQAAGFASAAAMNDASAMELLLRATGVGASDRVLDVACGPGIVAAALAQEAERAVGIDLTPQMVAQARRRCAAQGLSNVSFDVGDVARLPYLDGAFTIVTCRYALHHLVDPGDVVKEMARVCAPGGRIVVADIVVGTDPAVAHRFNDVERARDPSHVRALTAKEILTAMRTAGLSPQLEGAYQLAVELESLLARSASPDPDDVRARFGRAIATGETLGLGERNEDGKIRFEFPIVLAVGELA